MTNAMPLVGLAQGSKMDFGKWFRTTLVVFLVSLCLISAGCSFASFTAAVEADLPVVIQMVSNITNIVAPGISGVIVTSGTLALASLKILCGTPAIGASKCDATSLVGQYQVATDPSMKTTLLQKIQAALSAVNSQINNMLSLATNLPPYIGAAIAVALGVALETVTLLISLIPKLTSKNFSVTRAQYPAHPNSLKKRFNAAIGVQFPSAVVN